MPQSPQRLLQPGSQLRPTSSGDIILVFKHGIGRPYVIDGNEMWVSGAESLPIAFFVKPFQLFVRQTVLQDTIRAVGIEAAAVFSQRFLPGDVDVEYGAVGKHVRGDMLKSGGESAMLAAAGEFDDGGVPGVIFRIVAQAFLVLQPYAFDQEMPEPGPFEVAICVSVQTGLAHAFEDGVFFEPGPEHGEIVDFVESADVEASTAVGFMHLLEIIDDLAFAGGGASDQEKDVEGVLGHDVELKTND